MKMGVVESFIILFPRIMLLAIVVLLVVIVVKMSQKNKNDTPKKEQPKVGYGMNDAEKKKTKER